MKRLYAFLFLIALSFTTNAGTPFDGNIIISDFKLDGVEISWTTSKEVDNKEFIIEASLDGKEWKSVKHIKGELYSDIDRKYDFKFSPPTETTYFRLKRVDMEGIEETYSKVLVYEVRKEKPFFTYQVENKKIVFSTNDGDARITILDMTGNEVYNGLVKDGETLAINEGIHFLKIKTVHQQIFKQVIIE